MNFTPIGLTLLLGAPLQAQDLPGPRLAPGSIEKSTEAYLESEQRRGVDPRFAPSATPPPSVAGPAKAGHPWRGALLGGVAGFFGGAVIGYNIDRAMDCGCDDPGVMGLLIGAPVGAVAGSGLGFVIAR